MGGGGRVLGFCGFGYFLDQVLYKKKNFGFSVLVSIAVSVLLRSRFTVLDKNRIGFSKLLFDAVW